MSVVHLTVKDFKEKVLGSEQPVIVDFWASWCVPCQMLGPIIEELSDELDGEVVVGKVNIDEEQALAEEYGVFSIPTVIIFKDGGELERLVGVRTKEEYMEVIH